MLFLRIREKMVRGSIQEEPMELSRKQEKAVTEDPLANREMVQ